MDRPSAGTSEAAGEGQTAVDSGSLHRPFTPWQALSDDVLDVPVRALVQALNRSGWLRTAYSCGGHPDEPDAVARGRCQAHVDVLVRDPARWRRLADACRRDAPRAVQRLGLPGVRLRCARGSLGKVPPWLAEMLDGEVPARWQYERLVFEPVPHRLDPAVCRLVLDTALAVAVEATVATIATA